MPKIFLIIFFYRVGRGLDNVSAKLSDDEGNENDSELRVTAWIEGTLLSEHLNFHKIS